MFKFSPNTVTAVYVTCAVLFWFSAIITAITISSGPLIFSFLQISVPVIQMSVAAGYTFLATRRILNMITDKDKP